jgi:type IV secretion system protein VirD4
MVSGQKNQSVRFAVSSVLTFLMCMIVASWVATQYFAALLEYHPGLGEAVLDWGSRKVYQPFSWFTWTLEWINETGMLRDYITRMQLIVVVGVFTSVGIGIYMYYRRSLKNEVISDLHGSARFATMVDVKKMNLMGTKGVYLGAFDSSDGRRHVLRYDEAAHVLVFAPTRSGKGVGLVLPTLLSYPHSTATNDIKGENFELTSGFRHVAGTLCILFDPTSTDQYSIDGTTRYNVTSRWNVLDEVRIWTVKDVMDAQNIAAAIADPDSKGMEDHWVSTSYEVLTGVILHVLYCERNKSLSGVATYLADPTFTEVEQIFLNMLHVEHDPQGIMGWLDSLGKPTKTHPQVAIVAQSMLNKEERERTSVLSTAKTKLALYTEPIVAKNITRSDFCVSDLMNHDKPVSFYLKVSPGDKERLRPLIRLFFTFMLRRLTEKMDFEDGGSVKGYRHRLLALIDELPSLRKLDVLQDGLAYIAGFGITAYLIVQDLVQLRDAYGDKQSIISGCHVRIAYAPNTVETAEEISKMTGVTTVTRQSVSYSGSRISSMLGQMSVSEELVQRPLMTSDEVMSLPHDDSLIFIAGNPVIRGKKLKYYEMPEFLRRAKIQSPSRVAMTYRGENDVTCTEWFMVLVEHSKNSQDLKASICCYRRFPAVRVVVKQEYLATEQVVEYEYQMVDSQGQVIDRDIGPDDHEFLLKPVSASGFDPMDGFEVHFTVVDPAPYEQFSQMGFSRVSSAHEKAARDLAKKHFRENGDIDLNIDPTEPDGNYSGVVLLETDHYVILQRNKDTVSLHRKSKLSHVLSIRQHVTIKYQGKNGTVVC